MWGPYEIATPAIFGRAWAAAWSYKSFFGHNTTSLLIHRVSTYPISQLYSHAQSARLLAPRTFRMRKSPHKVLLEDATGTEVPQWNLLAPALHQVLKLSRAEMNEDSRRGSHGSVTAGALANPSPHVGCAIEEENEVANEQDDSLDPVTVLRIRPHWKAFRLLHYAPRDRGLLRRAVRYLPPTELRSAGRAIAQGKTSTGAPLGTSVGQSPIEILPPELLAIVLGYLTNDKPATIGLALASRRLWCRVLSEYILRNVHSRQYSAPDPTIVDRQDTAYGHMMQSGQWAGTPLICTSTWLVDLPQSMLAVEPRLWYRDGWKDIPHRCWARQLESPWTGTNGWRRHGYWEPDYVHRIPDPDLAPPLPSAPVSHHSDEVGGARRALGGVGASGRGEAGMCLARMWNWNAVLTYRHPRDADGLCEKDVEAYLAAFDGKGNAFEQSEVESRWEARLRSWLNMLLRGGDGREEDEHADDDAFMMGAVGDEWVLRNLDTKEYVSLQVQNQPAPTITTPADQGSHPEDDTAATASLPQTRGNKRRLPKAQNSRSSKRQKPTGTLTQSEDGPTAHADPASMRATDEHVTRQAHSTILAMENHSQLTLDFIVLSQICWGGGITRSGPQPASRTLGTPGAQQLTTLTTGIWAGHRLDVVPRECFAHVREEVFLGGGRPSQAPCIVGAEASSPCIVGAEASSEHIEEGTDWRDVTEEAAILAVLAPRLPNGRDLLIPLGCPEDALARDEALVGPITLLPALGTSSAYMPRQPAVADSRLIGMYVLI
ncbi:uncharacterized protein B0I36DRAFT_354389 [Microdochium trichocladiopsis]|uniref:Uncharacterized protein n=1 Tax=Microdochium trichocladiopsis TaxID=1682393 RepID=A0A9P9BH37_9PEZI|nr:uncharacterized protein B0I36DRAFT_354389 [Microdochium trichocladiopsis]KAH7018074.1 hypothetical protein B0I36DRAFT_354389 [Microdochium trichocladiopsis]